MNEEVKHPVRTTEKTLSVIEALRECGGAGVTELAERLDVGKSSIHNHLSTLEAHGYVVQEGDEYRLSLRFLGLGGFVRNQMDLYRVGEPEIKALAEETGEKANLLVEERGQGVYLCRSKGRNAIGVDTYTGMRTYLHSTALGKAILAFTPEDRVNEIIDEHGLPKESVETITERDELFDELDRIRERGYSVDDEERVPGLRCVGAPIRGPDENVLGAISVSAPKSRMRGDRFDDEIPTTVLSTANVIELNISYP